MSDSLLERMSAAIDAASRQWWNAPEEPTDELSDVLARIALEEVMATAKPCGVCGCAVYDLPNSLTVGLPKAQKTL